MILYTESLVSKIHKVRYYPNESCLTATKVNSPSYIGSSVIATQELLRNGLARIIGSGAAVNILADTRLPDDEGPYVHKVNSALNNQMISSLMICLIIEIVI